jgi:hypothetical protein
LSRFGARCRFLRQRKSRVRRSDEVNKGPPGTRRDSGTDDANVPEWERPRHPIFIVLSWVTAILIGVQGLRGNSKRLGHGRCGRRAATLEAGRLA